MSLKQNGLAKLTLYPPGTHPVEAEYTIYKYSLHSLYVYSLKHSELLFTAWD